MRFAVAQSGGPTAAINASLAGVYEAAMDIQRKLLAEGSSEQVEIFGVLHGVQGLLDGNLIDLREQLSDPLKLALLKKTPASALGSCRFRLPDPETDDTMYRKLLEVLTKYCDCRIHEISR